ncbi:MAG: hypothetical protein KatS3mg129_2243 [Leptospiraceae bacterium]|nr:MAG: hypothetical protein KatS3mg129_2243 [Leptospiraceae bacterium]
MKKYILIILFTISKTIYTYKPYTIPFIQPMEISIAKNLLQQNITKNQNNSLYYTDITNFYFYKKPKITNYNINKLTFQPSFLSYYSPLNYYHYLSYQKNNFIEIELIPYLKHTEIPWKSAKREYNFYSSISYGFFLNQKETISAFFGIINEQKLHNEMINNYDPFIEYGKIFFTPGIQLRSSSVVLKTFLEMPFYHYDFIQKTQKIYTPTSENIKANFQIQIKH